MYVQVENKHSSRIFVIMKAREGFPKSIKIKKIILNYTFYGYRWLIRDDDYSALSLSLS